MSLNFQDTITLVDPVVDEYGTEQIGRMEQVGAIVGPATGYAQASHQASVTADAIAYLDPTNSFVVEVANRLEGMMVITSEGDTPADAWYRIDSVAVGRRSLTDYSLDHIQVSLVKTTGLPSVS